MPAIVEMPLGYHANGIENFRHQEKSTLRKYSGAAKAVANKRDFLGSPSTMYLSIRLLVIAYCD